MKQHISCYRNGHYERSAIAMHCHETHHIPQLNCISLIEHVQNRRHLNIIESAHIQDHQEDNNLLNRDNGPINSVLIKYI